MNGGMGDIVQQLDSGQVLGELELMQTAGERCRGGYEGGALVVGQRQQKWLGGRAGAHADLM